MKRELLKYKTIFISDVHLGSADCKIDQINYLLRNTTCEKLVLNGDIIDSWALKRGGKWLRSHTLFLARARAKYCGCLKTTVDPGLMEKGLSDWLIGFKVVATKV